MKNINKINPYWCKNILIWLNCGGKKTSKILDPSNGGIGTKLKMANKRLAKTMILKYVINTGLIVAGKNLIIKPKTSAVRMLEPGPAKATAAGPIFWSRNRYKLTGTGFA